MVTYDQIEKVNEQLKLTPIKGKQYVEVNQRIKAFRMLHPNGTLTTEIIALENGVVTMKASALDEEGKLIATGYAQEKESSSYINKTSFIENCETSAIGRALGMCGLGVDTSVASAEEVENAINNQNQEQEVSNKKQEVAPANEKQFVGINKIRECLKMSKDELNERCNKQFGCNTKDINQWQANDLLKELTNELKGKAEK